MSDQVPELASRGRRLAATGIDALCVPILCIFLVMVTGVTEDAEDYTSSTWILWVLLLAVLSYLILNGYLLWQSGQTLGKYFLGIATVSARDFELGQSQPPPWWRLIAIRAPFFALMFLIVVPWVALLPLIDHLLIWSKRRRCLHDMLAGTVVVNRNPVDSP